MSSRETIPKEAKIMSLLLHASGVAECEPKVITALQEYAFSYSSKILSGASKLADLAGKGSIDASDVRFAANRQRQQMSRPHSLDYYFEVMAKVNARPFPAPISSGPYTAALSDQCHSASFKITARRNQ